MAAGVAAEGAGVAGAAVSAGGADFVSVLGAGAGAEPQPARNIVKEKEVQARNRRIFIG